MSYSHGDGKIVRQVIAALEVEGVSVWFDGGNLVPGQAWDRAIGDALTAAPAVAIFLSARSVASDYISREIALALGSRIRVIPILLPDARFDILPVALRSIQALDINAFPRQRRISDTARTLARAIQEFKSQGSTDEVSLERNSLDL